MIDPVIPGVLNEAAKTSGGVLTRLLGPTADVMGQQLSDWYTRQNVRRVVERADAKAATTSSGKVPPRVAAEVLDKARWADDEFVAEYLSGVLATSRTPDGTDDRAVAWNAMVARLPSDSLRLHYVIYSALREKLRGRDTAVISDWTKRELVFTYVEMQPRVAFGEGDEWTERLIHAAYLLQREGLLSHMTHGGAEHLTGYPYGRYQLPENGDMLISATTVEGCLLFLQAHGYGGLWASSVGDENLQFHPWPEISPDFASVPAVWLDDLPPSGL